MDSQPWFVYLLECRSGRIYTGVTPDIVARMTKHNNGSGAMFTRLNRPEKLLAVRPLPGKVEAMRLEYQVKRLSAAHKRFLASRWREEYPLDQFAQQLPTLIENVV
jgi:putative endonuclease